jgi:hypothetical protein
LDLILRALADFGALHTQLFPDPMHTMPLGMAKHLLNATIQTVKTYVQSIVEEVTEFQTNFEISRLTELYASQPSLLDREDMPKSACDSSTSEGTSKAKNTAEKRQVKLQAILQAKKAQIRTRVTEAADPKFVMLRLHTRLCALSKVCPDIGLTQYMCDEVKRTWNRLPEAKHKSNGQMKAHEWFTLALALPYVMEGLLS